jgi:LacI family transcriptional regulator
MSTPERKRRVALALNIEEPRPQHQGIYSGVQQYAAEHTNWICEIDQHPAYRANQRKFHEPYDGVIARASPQLQRRLRAQKIPLVNTHYQHNRDGLPGVFRDPVKTGQMAAEHLMERGFKRFATSHYSAHKHKADVFNAFKSRIKDYGFEINEAHSLDGDAEDPQLWMKWEARIHKWVNSLQCPIGVFVGTEFTARMICQIAKRLGLHVPQDIAILCGSNTRAILEVSPQISAIEDNYERIGYEAAALLDRLMNGEQVPERAILIPPRGVVARESTDHYAVEDELVADALRYISANMSRKISVEDIAYELAVSRRTLQIRFNAALGIGVSEEMRRLRLSAVKVRLADPEQSIEQIARQTGFASAGALCHTFKREVGIAPSEYRKGLEGEH